MASKHDGSKSIKRFADCAVEMRNMLYDDRPLSDSEFHFMDSHFQVLELAYFRWKQKRIPHVSPSQGPATRPKAA
jgi:hypothetical protein